MSVLPFHVAFMSLALLCMVFGISAARFLRSRKWWLKAHRAINTTAAACVGAGFVFAVLLTRQWGGMDAAITHRAVGFIAVAAAAAVTAVGHAIFTRKGKEAISAWKRSHRWLGRTEALLMPATIVFGLFLVGIF